MNPNLVDKVNMLKLDAESIPEKECSTEVNEHPSSSETVLQSYFLSFRTVGLLLSCLHDHVHI